MFTGVAGTVNLTENDPAHLFAAATVLSDPDSGDFNGGQISVTYTAGGSAQDQFTIADGGNITFDGTDVTFSGVGIIATVNGSHNGTNGETLVLDLTGLANAARVQELLAQITYQNTSKILPLREP